MVSTTEIVKFFKSKVPTFVKSFGYKSKFEEGEKTLIRDFIDHVADDVVYSAIVTKKELAVILNANGIDRKFVNAHLDTLIRIEKANFTDISKVPEHRFIKDCIDLMQHWFEQSKSNPNPFYTEVRHDYHNDEEGYWTIDAWRTPDDDEEGVAPIEVYDDGHLQIRDENAWGFAICELNIIEAIEETLKQIKSK